MNREKNEGLEKDIEEARLNDRRGEYDFFHTAAVPYERRRPIIDISSKKNITDSLIATYWG